MKNLLLILSLILSFASYSHAGGNRSGNPDATVTPIVVQFRDAQGISRRTVNEFAQLLNQIDRAAIEESQKQGAYCSTNIWEIMSEGDWTLLRLDLTCSGHALGKPAPSSFDIERFVTGDLSRATGYSFSILKPCGEERDERGRCTVRTGSATIHN